MNEPRVVRHTPHFSEELGEKVHKVPYDHPDEGRIPLVTERFTLVDVENIAADSCGLEIYKDRLNDFLRGLSSILHICTKEPEDGFSPVMLFNSVRKHIYNVQLCYGGERNGITLIVSYLIGEEYIRLHVREGLLVPDDLVIPLWISSPGLLGAIALRFPEFPDAIKHFHAISTIE